jgi:ketosteroid isomerase-like protein
MKLSIRLLLALLASLMLMSGAFADSHEAEVTTPESILMQADVALASAATNKEMDQFYARILEDVVFLAPNAPIAKGPESFGTLFELPAVALNWQPVFANVSASGDLGYTFGTYELSFDGPDGVRIVDNGKYMTVWKKGTDGSWKVAADMFNTSLPLPTMEEASK